MRFRKRRQPAPVVLKKLLHKTSHKAGRAPGTMVHIGRQRTEPVRIGLLNYGPAHLEERSLASAAECRPYRDGPGVTWVNLDGIHQLGILEQLGADFGLHPLVLEDIVNTTHRPKMEAFDDYLFLVLKMPHYDPVTASVNTEQVCLILSRNHVLSFQEQQGDVFDGVRQRLRGNKGRLRTMGADYLAYVLIDAIVDSYYIIMESLGEEIEHLEEIIMDRPTPDIQSRIHHFKREMILLRKAVWPLRELISGLQREESSLIAPATGVFLRDVYDHSVQIIDTVETLRDVLSGLLDLYMSNISNRMNEVMKVLTIIATIFIPLTFIAGIYGMNFEYMPELHWRWSYPLLWLLMLTLACGMFKFFRRKHWL